MAKTKLMRVDGGFSKYVKSLQQKLALRGILVSERRITQALTRVKGQENWLLNANWIDNEIRRAAR